MDAEIRELERKLDEARRRAGLQPAVLMARLDKLARRIWSYTQRYNEGYVRSVGRATEALRSDWPTFCSSMTLQRRWRSVYRAWLRATDQREAFETAHINEAGETVISIRWLVGGSIWAHDVERDQTAKIFERRRERAVEDQLHVELRTVGDARRLLLVMLEEQAAEGHVAFMASRINAIARRLSVDPHALSSVRLSVARSAVRFSNWLDQHTTRYDG